STGSAIELPGELEPPFLERLDLARHPRELLAERGQLPVVGRGRELLGEGGAALLERLQLLLDLSQARPQGRRAGALRGRGRRGGRVLAPAGPRRGRLASAKRARGARRAPV